MYRSIFALSIAVALLQGCARQQPQQSAKSPATLNRLGSHTMPITTSNPEAQHAFNRGLTWTYAFAHHAAEQEFKRAAEADPNCAMAYWGIALVNGPHINFPMVPPDRAKAAWAAIQKAEALLPRCNAREQALIKALRVRYADPQPEDRSPLDQAYADAMRELWRQYPQDADIGALCAEAAMDLHPWDLWVDGKTQPWTPEILAILERVMQLNPQHPGANHYYIHCVEASHEPGRALASADRLLRQVPDASHLVHMPAHIYARVGNWDKVALSNQKAMQADQRYRQVYPRPGFYGLYMAHNTHFLAFAGMMRGESEQSLQLARKMVQQIPEDFVQEYGPVADGFLVFVPEVLMRFGRWEEILQEPPPRGGLPYSTAYWHFTRAVALTALGRMDEARSEQQQFEKRRATLPADAAFGNNSGADLLKVASLVLKGEMQARENQWDASIATLREAVAAEDKLRYDEPPDWIQPVRHTLGAVLLRAGRPEEAEEVYRQDLQVWPNNGWSLLGLREALEKQGKGSESGVAAAQLRKVWAKADVEPETSCYCQAQR